MSLRDFLKVEKGYTDAEIEETMLRRDNGMSLSKEVEEDIREYVRDFLVDFSKY